MTKRSSLLAESAQLFADFRSTNDVIPVIDVATVIANALHPAIKGEGRRKLAQRLQTKQAWEEKIETAIGNELPVLHAVTLERLNPAADPWLGSACVTREALVAWLRLHDKGSSSQGYPHVAAGSGDSGGTSCVGIHR